MERERQRESIVYNSNHRRCRSLLRRPRKLNLLPLKSNDEMGAMGLGERFSFALDRDHVRAHLCARLDLVL